MKKKLLFIAAISILGIQCSKSDKTDTADDSSKLISANDQSTKDRYIIKFRDDLLNKSLISLDENLKDKLSTVISPFVENTGIDPSNIVHYYTNVYPGIAVSLTDEQLSKVLNHNLVDLVSLDEKITLGDFEEQNLKSNLKGQNTPWGISRVGSADGTGKTAWIIDTGVDLDHPDLKVDALRSQSFATGDGTFLSNGGDDNHGHGTHVAGTVAAIDNNVGVKGVAAGATVVAIKVLGGNGTGLLSDVIAGVDYTAGLSLPGDVANMSLSSGANSLMDLAVQSASLGGTWYVMAAGNDRRDANLNSPARANGPFLVTVSAFRSGDTWASFSNYGNPPVDYAAPGQSVYSTYRNGSYRTLSGTSMAAPHVAGLYLISNGAPNSYSTVLNDPDGTPDPIAEL